MEGSCNACRSPTDFSEAVPTYKACESGQSLIRSEILYKASLKAVNIYVILPEDCYLGVSAARKRNFACSDRN